MCCGVVPGEALLFEERRKWSRDRAVVVDELAVVPREAEEAADGARGAGHRPSVDGLYLGWVHSDARGGDDVAKVGDRGHPERALGEFDEELVLAQEGEHDAKVP